MDLAKNLSDLPGLTGSAEIAVFANVGMTERIGHWLDRFGVLASLACAAHCLIAPFLVGLIPLVGLSFLFSETAERSLIAATVIVCIFSLLPAYIRQHKKLHSIILATLGLGLIILTHLQFEDNLAAKATFLITGAILVSTAHLLNRRLCRACVAC